MASAWVSLPGAGAELLERVHAAALAHGGDPGERLERADQDRRADPLRLADRVDERVDAVGAVDVGRAGRAEEHVRARRQPDVGVAGGLGLVVGLGLHDHARRVARGAAMQPTRSRATSTHRAARRTSRRAAASRRGLAVQLRAGVGELLAHARERRAALGHLGLQPRAPARAPRRTRRRARRSGAPDPRARSSDSGRPESSASRTRPATMPCDCAERHAARAPAGRRCRWPRSARRRPPREPLAVEARSPRASRPPPAGTGRACRPRRTGAPCPPACPCCRSAGGRAARRGARPAGRRRAAPWPAAARRRPGSSSGA